jgi:GTPase SAR1 family protein
MDPQEFFYKICIVGEIGSGKTSFVKKYVHGTFSDHLIIVKMYDILRMFKKHHSEYPLRQVISSVSYTCEL